MLNILKRIKINVSYLNCAGGAANKAPPCLEAARDGANPSSF